MFSLAPLCQLCGKSPGCIRPHLASVLSLPICSACLDGDRFRYNDQRIGLPSFLPTFSLEFEIHTCSSTERDRALMLLHYSYIRTDDATVSDEYKSPIYHSLSAFRSHLSLLDALRGLVDERCGTHLHVGFSPDLSGNLLTLSDAVFSPLACYLRTHPDETERFWGRFFCTYATSTTRTYYPWVRILTPYDTLEYRLPRFRRAWQYVEVVRFCRRMTAYLEQTLSTLEARRDPFGKGEQAARLRQTPACMGEQILSFYHDALRQFRRQLQRQEADPLHALPSVS